MGFHEIAFEITGDGLENLSTEAGGHRIQRVPDTEKNGRVHTSTVTVAVMDENVAVDPRLLMRTPDCFRSEGFSGGGAGGQHKNRHPNDIRMTHVPTNTVQISRGRSKESNLRSAREGIIAALDEQIAQAKRGIISADRKSQVGSGMRGDKVRTYRFQEDTVRDHRSGRQALASKIMRGNFDLLW